MTSSSPRCASVLVAVAVTLVLGACAPKEATTPSAGAAASAAAAASAVPQPGPPEPGAEEARLSGKHDLWQDGEGGPVCHVTLTTTPTIGGNAIQAEDDCDRKLKLGGDPFAWFINPAGVVVIVDPARRPLLHLERLADGSYKDRRDGGDVNAVLLTRR